MSMIHYLTVGYLDPEAIRDCVAVASKPLDAGIVRRLLAEFPGLKLEQKDGLVIVHWHGLGQVAQGEEFTLRLMQATGCIVADRRNGRLIAPAELKGLPESRAVG
jgi:hypothetical protein